MLSQFMEGTSNQTEKEQLAKEVQAQAAAFLKTDGKQARFEDLNQIRLLAEYSFSPPKNIGEIEAYPGSYAFDEVTGILVINRLPPSFNAPVRELVVMVRVLEDRDGGETGRELSNSEIVFRSNGQTNFISQAEKINREARIEDLKTFLSILNGPLNFIESKEID